MRDVKDWNVRSKWMTKVEWAQHRVHYGHWFNTAAAQIIELSAISGFHWLAEVSMSPVPINGRHCSINPSKRPTADAPVRPDPPRYSARVHRGVRPGLFTKVENTFHVHFFGVVLFVLVLKGFLGVHLSGLFCHLALMCFLCGLMCACMVVYVRIWTWNLAQVSLNSSRTEGLPTIVWLCRL